MARGEGKAQAHTCHVENLVVCHRPIETGGDDGSVIHFQAVCHICGKVYHEVYSRNDGYWDPEKRKYVDLPGGESKPINTDYCDQPFLEDGSPNPRFNPHPLYSRTK